MVNKQINKEENMNKHKYDIRLKVWLYRTDIGGYTLGYITGYTKKRISAFNYTLDRIGHYKPEHVKYYDWSEVEELSNEKN